MFVVRGSSGKGVADRLLLPFYLLLMRPGGKTVMTGAEGKSAASRPSYLPNFHQAKAGSDGAAGCQAEEKREGVFGLLIQPDRLPFSCKPTFLFCNLPHLHTGSMTDKTNRPHLPEKKKKERMEISIDDTTYSLFDTYYHHYFSHGMSMK